MDRNKNFLSEDREEVCGLSSFFRVNGQNPKMIILRFNDFVSQKSSTKKKGKLLRRRSPVFY